MVPLRYLLSINREYLEVTKVVCELREVNHSDNPQCIYQSSRLVSGATVSQAKLTPKGV